MTKLFTPQVDGIVFNVGENGTPNIQSAPHGCRALNRHSVAMNYILLQNGVIDGPGINERFKQTWEILPPSAA